MRGIEHFGREIVVMKEPIDGGTAIFRQEGPNSESKRFVRNARPFSTATLGSALNAGHG
jgi:hypothetical protein